MWVSFRQGGRIRGWGHRSGTRYWRLRWGFVQAWVLVKAFQGEILTVLNFLKDASKKHKSFIQFKTVKGLSYLWRCWSLNVHFTRRSFTKCLYGKHLHKSHTPKGLPIVSQKSVKSMGPEWWDLHPLGFFLLHALCWVWAMKSSKVCSLSLSLTHTHHLSAFWAILGKLRQMILPEERY